MAHFGRDITEEIEFMQRKMNRVLYDLGTSKPRLVRFARTVWEPSVDIYETEKDFVIDVELAGTEHSDIEIIVESKLFTIRGQRRRPSTEKRVYHQMEIISGPFERSFTLPVLIDPERATATSDNGILKIVLPKSRQTNTINFRVVIG